MNINDIKPKIKGVSDKFSWGLYQWFKKHGTNFRILLDITQADIPILYNIYIIQRTHGSKLMSIMQGNRDIYCYDMFPLEEYKDITDEFWKEYLSIGRCMFDKSHTGWWLGDDTRYTVINKNSKRCNWCGKYLKRNIRKHVSVKRKEHWEVI